MGAVGFLRSGVIAVGGSGDNINQVNCSSCACCADYYEGVNSIALCDVSAWLWFGISLSDWLLSSGWYIYLYMHTICYSNHTLMHDKCSNSVLLRDVLQFHPLSLSNVFVCWVSLLLLASPCVAVSQCLVVFKDSVVYGSCWCVSRTFLTY